MPDMPVQRTARAMLFSEQIALMAKLNQPWVAELKQQLESAQELPEINDPVPRRASLHNLSSALVFAGAAAAVAATFLRPDVPYLVIGAAATCGIGQLGCMIVGHRQRIQTAQLVRALANALAKKRKETTNPGAANPLKPR